MGRASGGREGDGECRAIGIPWGLADGDAVGGGDRSWPFSLTNRSMAGDTVDGGKEGIGSARLQAGFKCRERRPLPPAPAAGPRREQVRPMRGARPWRRSMARRCFSS